jgi:hypothetical protein
MLGAFGGPRGEHCRPNPALVAVLVAAKPV